MPTVPKSTQCTALRCIEPRADGSAYCISHGGRLKLSANRLMHNAPYKTRLWEKIRAAQLSRVPLCERCGMNGRITAAAHVDHVFPWGVIGGDSFRNNVFSSLCGGCHSVKTAAERRGIFERYTAHGVIEYTAADYSRIVGG